MGNKVAPPPKDTRIEKEMKRINSNYLYLKLLYIIKINKLIKLIK